MVAEWICPGCGATREAKGIFVCDCGEYGFDQPSVEISGPKVVSWKDRPTNLFPDNPIALSEDGSLLVFKCFGCGHESKFSVDGPPDIYTCLSPDCEDPWVFDPSAHNEEPIPTSTKAPIEFI